MGQRRWAVGGECFSVSCARQARTNLERPEPADPWPTRLDQLIFQSDSNVTAFAQSFGRSYLVANRCKGQNSQFNLKNIMSPLGIVILPLLLYLFF